MSHLLLTQRANGGAVKLASAPSRPGPRRSIIRRFKEEDKSQSPADKARIASGAPHIPDPDIPAPIIPDVVHDQAASSRAPGAALPATAPPTPAIAIDPVHDTTAVVSPASPPSPTPTTTGKAPATPPSPAPTTAGQSLSTPPSPAPTMPGQNPATPPSPAPGPPPTSVPTIVPTEIVVPEGASASGMGPPLPAVDVPGPGPRASLLGVPVPSTAGTLSSLIGWGFLAVALATMVTPKPTLLLLFPSAVHQSGSGFLAALWGASLVPLAAASITLKGVVDSQMTGTRGADQLNVAVLTGCALTLMVTLQALSLRHTPFNALVGGLAGCGLVLTSWLATRAHPWALPGPNFGAILGGLLSSFSYNPRYWSSWAWTAVCTGLIGTGFTLMRLSFPGGPAVLLGGAGPGAAAAETLAIFAGRACGGALMTSGLLCALLAGAADRRLLAARTALLLSTSVATSAILISLIISLSIAVNVALPSRTLWIILFGQVAVGAWALAATAAPVGVQSASSWVVGPGGRHHTLEAPRSGHAAVGLMTDQQFWEAMALPPEEY